MSNVELIANLYDSFGRGDIESVLGAMAPGIHWHEAEGNPYLPSGEALVGPQAVLETVFSRIGDDWDDFKVNPATYHDAGDVVVVEARYTGGRKGTDRSLDAQVCHIWTVNNGKVAKFQQYLDTGQMQELMGLQVA